MKLLDKTQTNWKYILIVVILTATTAGGILTYKYWGIPQGQFELEITTPEQPSEIDTSGWKTYRNEEYGFEIKYPRGWEALNNNPYNQVLDFSFRDKKYNGSFEWPGFRITDADIAGEFGDIKFPSKVFRKEEIEDDVIRIYFDDHGKRMYGTCVLYLEPNVIDICNQILSTFKFIEPSESEIDTSDWKIYRNEKYGFEVKYPQEYSFWETHYPPNKESLIDVGFRPEDIQGSVFIVTVLNIPLKDLQGGLYGEPTQEKVIVGGSVGMKFSGHLPCMVGVEKDEYTFFFICHGIRKEDPLIFDQILSTFRFLD